MSVSRTQAGAELVAIEDVVRRVKQSRMYRISGEIAILWGVLVYGFGLLWSRGVAQFDGRQTTVFWHTLFLCGYSLAGLWFGYGFLLLGLGATAAIFAVYIFAGVWFFPAIAVVSGLSYVLCGLWMLRR